MANDHQIHVFSLDLSPKLQTHKFIFTWMAIRHLKLNMSQIELEISTPMLLENGNDNASLPGNWAVNSGIILDLSLLHSTLNLLINSIAYYLISKIHPHLTTACHLHCCHLSPSTNICCLDYCSTCLS